LTIFSPLNIDNNESVIRLTSLKNGGGIIY
jgi:hypothetical protein